MDGRAALVRYVRREETSDDASFVFELFLSTTSPSTAFAGLSPSEQERIRETEYDLQRQTIEAVFPTARAEIIEVDGEPAGELIVDHGRDRIRLIDIALLPRYRGEGIGGDLVRSLCDEAAARRLPLELAVATENVAARRLYDRLGFRETSADSLFVEMVWRG